MEAIEKLGLGAGTLGNLYKAITNAQARNTVAAAWDVGIRHFDTAPFYGLGLSERRLGDALRVYPRGEYKLSSKVGRLLTPISETSNRFGFVDPLPFEPVYDYSYDGVMRSFEDSLQRLGLPSIDCLYMHDIGEVTHGSDHRKMLQSCKSGLTALQSLKEQGAISEFGLGVNETEICEILFEECDMDRVLLAGRYSLLNHAPLSGFFDLCQSRAVKITAAGIFNSGILATGVGGSSAPYYDYAPASKAIVKKVRKIESICSEFDVALPAAATAFVIAHPAVDNILLGMSGAARVRSNAKMMEADVPSELWTTLASKDLIPASAPTPA